MELTWCRAQLFLLASACVSSLEVLERVVHTPENNVICPQVDYSFTEISFYQLLVTLTLTLTKPCIHLIIKILI